jgi:transcriptional regulator with XRE-family HTH domain
MAKTRINAPALQDALDQVRIERGLSWRQLAVEIGVTPSLLSRLRNGYKPDAEGFMTLVHWLGIPAERFLLDSHEGARQPALMAELAPLLRARKDLSKDDVEYLQEVIQATLKRASAKRGERD